MFRVVTLDRRCTLPDLSLRMVCQYYNSSMLLYLLSLFQDFKNLLRYSIVCHLSVFYTYVNVSTTLSLTLKPAFPLDKCVLSFPYTIPLIKDTLFRNINLNLLLLLHIFRSPGTCGILVMASIFTNYVLCPFFILMA